MVVSTALRAMVLPPRRQGIGRADSAADGRDPRRAAEGATRGPGKPARYFAESGGDLPVAESYGRDLTESARQGKLDPVIGRDEEIRRVIQVLSRRTKNNPVLIGEPGVGKTAIVEGLPFATWTIIAINVLVFFFELSMPEDTLQRFFYLFGIVPARFTHPEWARLGGCPSTRTGRF